MRLLLLLLLKILFGCLSNSTILTEKEPKTGNAVQNAQRGEDQANILFVVFVPLPYLLRYAFDQHPSVLSDVNNDSSR